MKIYTRTGDAGKTGLIGGARVGKDHARVEAYGQVDELNAAVGWAIVACDRGTIAAELREIQDDLFRVGAELASDEGRTPPQRLDPGATARLEKWLDAAWNPLPQRDGGTAAPGSDGLPPGGAQPRGLGPQPFGR
jgi:cob(I)alamin adenosyltransferase